MVFDFLVVKNLRKKPKIVELNWINQVLRLHTFDNLSVAQMPPTENIRQFNWGTLFFVRKP